MRIIFSLLAILIFLPNLAFAAQQQDLLKVFIYYNKGQANFTSIEVGSGFIPGEKNIDRSAPVFWLEVIADNGEILIRKEFNIHLEIMMEPPLPGDEHELDSRELLLEETTELVIIPYFFNVKWLNLYNANRNLLEKQDIAYMSQVCGNGVCQNNEDNSTCPNDCLEDKKEKKLINSCNSNGECVFPETAQNCPQDCVKAEQAVDKINVKNIKIIIAIIAIAIIIIIMIAAYYFLVRKTSQTQITKDEKKENSQD